MAVEFMLSEQSTQLDQYYRLRERCFREDLGISGFDGSEEDVDRLGRILIAMDGEQCLGGVRISEHTPLQSQLEVLRIEEQSCCVWERFAIDPRVRSIEFVHRFCSHLVEATRDAGFDHAMVLSSLRNARLYRRCHSALGVDFEIHRPVPHCAQGDFAGLEHYLSVAYLQKPEPLRLAV